MLLNYFIVDVDQQLRRVDRTLVEDVWQGTRDAGELGHEVGGDLRILSVLCEEEDLQPQMCFFAKAHLRHGQITEKSRFQAYEAMAIHQKQPGDPATTESQLAGWPSDWQTQLAVAVDVPAVELRKIGVGGPLLMADLWGFSIDRILEYFDEASEEK